MLKFTLPPSQMFFLQCNWIHMSKVYNCPTDLFFAESQRLQIQCLFKQFKLTQYYTLRKKTPRSFGTLDALNTILSTLARLKFLQSQSAYYTFWYKKMPILIKLILRCFNQIKFCSRELKLDLHHIIKWILFSTWKKWS